MPRTLPPPLTLDQRRQMGLQIDAKVRPPTPAELRAMEAEKSDKKSKWNDFFRNSPVALMNGEYRADVFQSKPGDKGTSWEKWQGNTPLSPAPQDAAPLPPVTYQSLSTNATHAMDRGQITKEQHDQWQQKISEATLSEGSDPMDIGRAMRVQAQNQPSVMTTKAGPYGKGFATFGVDPLKLSTHGTPRTTPPAPGPLQAPRPQYVNGQQKQDAAGNNWTYDAKLGRGVMNNPLLAPHQPAAPATVGGIAVGTPEWNQLKSSVANNASLAPSIKPNALTSRAYGGPVVAGQPFIGNDGGDGTAAQIYVPGQDGTVIPAAAPGAPGSPQEVFIPADTDAPPLPLPMTPMPDAPTMDYGTPPQWVGSPLPTSLPSAPSVISNQQSAISYSDLPPISSAPPELPTRSALDNPPRYGDPRVRTMANVIPADGSSATVAPRPDPEDYPWREGEKLDFIRLESAEGSGRATPAERARLAGYRNGFFEHEQNTAATNEANFKAQQHAADQAAIQRRHVDNRVDKVATVANNIAARGFFANQTADRADARQERSIAATADAKKVEQARKDAEEEKAVKYFSDRIGQLQRSGALSLEEAAKLRKFDSESLKYEFERRDAETKNKAEVAAALQKHREDKGMDAAFKSRDQAAAAIKEYKDATDPNLKAIYDAALKEYQAASKIIKDKTPTSYY